MREGLRRWAGSCLLLACGAAACDEPTGSRRFRVHSAGGDGQVDTVGAVLSQALVAEVRDHRGNPVSGRTVEFAVVSGGGSVHPATARADARGRAQAHWTLGTRVGEAQRVEARVAQASGGSVPDTFAATVRPGAPARMEAVSPLRLSGVRGRPLADSVAVRILDRFDNPAEGQSVQWSGGSASPQTSPTRADGTARTQWTLSSVVGEQTLQAVAGDRSTTFVATASPPPVSVELTVRHSTVTGDTVQFIAFTGASLTPVTGVTVSVEGRSTEAGFDPGERGWPGALVLSGLSYGPKVLQAVAVDAAGNADTARVNIHYDAVPRLIVEAPEDGLVVGSYRVRATCQDNDPCTITVSRDGVVVAQAQGSIDQVFEQPSGYANAFVLRVQTQDAWRRTAMVERHLYAINEPRWTLVARLPGPLGGYVLDIDATRLLLRHGAVVQRATGAVTQVFPQEPLARGYLTRQGAIAVWGGVLEWRNGTVAPVGNTWGGGIRVAGRWAAWRQLEPQAFRPDVATVVRDLETGAMRELERISSSDTRAELDRVDVAENGDVVFLERGGNLVRYRNGIRTVLVPPGVQQGAAYVRTDGNVVVYRFISAQRHSLRMIDGAGADIEIAPLDPAFLLDTHNGLVVRDGWIAYRRSGTLEGGDLWIRSPDGTQQQLSDGTPRTNIEALSANGKLVFAGRESPRRVFVPGRGTTTVGGPWSGAKVFWIGDELYGSWGGGLFRIDY